MSPRCASPRCRERSMLGAGPASRSRGLDQGAARGEFGPRGPPRSFAAWTGHRGPVRLDPLSFTVKACSRRRTVGSMSCPSPSDRRLSQGSQSVGTDGHQLSRRSVRDCCDGPAGGLAIMGPDLLQLTGHVVKRDDVASLEDVSNHVIGPVLALRPQPQCGKQVRGFGDEVAAACRCRPARGCGPRSPAATGQRAGLSGPLTKCPLPRRPRASGGDRHLKNPTGWWPAWAGSGAGAGVYLIGRGARPLAGPL